MALYSIKPAFQRRLRGLRDGCIRLGITADALTVSAVFLSILGGASIAASRHLRLLLLLVPVLAVGRLALNALDGMVAVASATARPFGEVLNETLDRVSDVVWFGGLALVIHPVISLSAVVLVLISSYVGTVAKAAGGPRIYSGLMGKADRMILLSLGAVVAIFFDPKEVLTITVIVIGIGAMVTIFQRMIVAKKSLEKSNG